MGSSAKLYLFVPSIRESGKLTLSPKEAATYRAAAERLGEACDMVLDLTQPITVEEWILLEAAHTALNGQYKPLDEIIGKVEAEVQSRRRRV